MTYPDPSCRRLFLTKAEAVLSDSSERKSEKETIFRYANMRNIEVGMVVGPAFPARVISDFLILRLEKNKNFWWFDMA